MKIAFGQGGRLFAIYQGMATASAGLGNWRASVDYTALFPRPAADVIADWPDFQPVLEHRTV
jgi:hypothetical protein